jgi:hypothetical protein
MRPFAAVAALLVSASALSAQGTTFYPGLTATFITPFGAVAPTDPVDVWLRLSLAPSAPALNFDGFSPATQFGLPASLVPTTGRTQTGITASFATYRTAQTTVGLACPNGFGPPATPPGISPAPCGGTAYRFTPNTAGNDPSFNFLMMFSLAPGGSFDFRVGTFTPQPGGAPPGTYELYRLAPAIHVVGADAAGRQLTAITQLVQTCPSAPGPDCGFIRTVVGPTVVPEPAPVALVGAALVIVGGVAWRWRTAEA